MKKLKILISLLLIVVLLISPNTVNISATKSTHIDDDFYGDAINPEVWETEGDAALVNEGGAIQIKGGDFATSVGWKGLRDVVDSTGNGNGLSSDYSLEVTVSAIDTSWFALYIGCYKSAQRFAALGEGNPGSVLVFSTSNITHYIGQGIKATDSASVVASGSEEAKADAAAHKSVYGFNNIRFDGTRYCIKLDAHFGTDTGEDRSQNYVDVYMVAEPANRTEDTVIEYGEKIARVHYANVAGYFSFGSMNSGVANFSNIKVTDTATNEVIYTPSNNLEKPTVEHVVGSGSPDYKNYEFRVWNSSVGQYSSMITNGTVGYMKMKGEASLISKLIVNPDMNSYSIYDIEIKMNALNLGSQKLQFVLGSDETGYSAISLSKVLGTKVQFEDYKGKTKEHVLTAGDHLYKFYVKADNTVQMYIDGEYVETFAIEKLGGNPGVKTANGQEVNLTGYKLDTYLYQSSDAPSVSADFTVLDSEGKPYVSNDEFYVLGNARRLKGYNEINFINAKKGSFLATKHKYSEYVVKFDLYDITQNDSNNIITFSFGKDAYNLTHSECKTLILVSRGYTEDEYGMPVAGKTNLEALTGLQFTNAGGKTSTSIALNDNIFNDEDFWNRTNGKEHMTIMFIVKDRTITMYYKFAGEPESVLSIPRAVCEDVDTYGYFSIGAATTANFTISNFSLTNLEFE